MPVILYAMEDTMETFVYEPQGVCAKRYTITVDNDNDTIRNIEIAGGCPGNLLGISHLLKGMKVDEVIERFDGVPCGLKTTSCPDQIARALKAYKQRS